MLSKTPLNKQKIQKLELIVSDYCCNPKKTIEQIYKNYEEVQEKIRDLKLNLPGFKFGQIFQRRALVVIEQPPAVRVLKFKNWDFDITINQYSLPYLIFVFSFYGRVIDDVQCYFRKDSLISPSDIVYRCPLPNISIDGYICMGGEHLAAKDNHVKSINYFFEQFWSSAFTNEIGSMNSFNEIRSTDPEHFASMETWAQWSQTNPGYALEAPYRKLGPLEDISDSIVNNFQIGKETYILGRIQDVIRNNINTLLLPRAKLFNLNNRIYSVLF